MKFWMSGEKVGEIWNHFCVVLCYPANQELKQHMKAVALFTLGKKREKGDTINGTKYKELVGNGRTYTRLYPWLDIALI